MRTGVYINFCLQFYDTAFNIKVIINACYIVFYKMNDTYERSFLGYHIPIEVTLVTMSVSNQHFYELKCFIYLCL